MIEEWRSVPDNPRYEVSDHGNVRRISATQGARANYVLSPGINASGRRNLTLYDGQGRRKVWRIARLVALAFLGPAPSDRHEVCHNDGNCANDVVSNLRWDTHSGNMLDTKKHGTQPIRRGAAAGRRTKITAEQAAAIRASPLSTTKLAAQYGIHQSQISRIKTGEAW